MTLPSDLLTGLQQCWDFEETSGTRINNVSGGADLLENGSVTSGSGIVGNAALFSNPNYLSFAAILSGNPISLGQGKAPYTGQPFTIAFWAFPTTTTDNRILIEDFPGGDNTHFFDVVLLPSMKILVAVAFGDEGLITASTQTLTQNAWNFIVVWHTGTVLNLQINNGTINTDATGSPLTSINQTIFETSLIWQMGGGASSNLGGLLSSTTVSLAGLLDSAMIWNNRVLTQAERDTVYNAGAGQSCGAGGAVVGTSYFYNRQQDMSQFLRQATDSQQRTIGPFVSSTDFKTLQTALNITRSDIFLIANGGSSVLKNNGGAIHKVNGMYTLAFNAIDSAVVGELEVSIAMAGTLVVSDKFFVVEEVIYDDLFAADATGFSGLGADVDEVLRRLPDELIGGRMATYRYKTRKPRT